MVDIKLFTMVKDEVDIIKEWILYHGFLFGYTNLFIVDNFSTDGTFEVINNFKDLGVHIFREADYKQKGDIMTKLIREYSTEIAYPIDIDEFIVYYDKPNNLILTDKDTILHYFSKLPVRPVYKTNYLISKITNDTGYENAVIETICGEYSNYGPLAKSFFNTTLFKNNIDHGNHYYTTDYYLTDLVLIHYHNRSLSQIKKKIYNNVLGLGYDLNIPTLKQLEANECNGFHHIANMIAILENRYTLPIHPHDTNYCLLKPLSDLMVLLHSIHILQNCFL